LKRRLLIGVLATLLVLAMLPPCAWWWAGSDGSLRRALQMAQWFLPDGQALAFRDAEGSIRGGGTIGQLQWSMPGTELTIDGLQVEWTLGQLFDHALDVRTLQARSVHVRLTPQPAAPAGEPFTMPADASLPIKLTLPLRIGSLQIESVAEDGAITTQVVDDIATLYRFDGTRHAFTISNLRYGDSQAQAELTLDAHDLALQAQLTASLRNLVPGTPFAMQLGMKANGTLGGGEEASLDVQVDGSEIGGSNAATSGAEIHGQATIRPWAAQPAEHIDLQLAHLNAHAFHGQAPVTDVQGHASLVPAGEPNRTGWNYTLDIANDAPGAWDQQRLPLKSIAASGVLDLQQLRIASASAELFGRSAAGNVTLNGAVPLRRPLESTLQLQLQQLNLQPLLSGLPRTLIGGTVGIDAQVVKADIRNTVPGPLDRERLPLEQLSAQLELTPELWRAEDVRLQIKGGALQVTGQFEPQGQALTLDGELEHLPVGEIHSRLAEGLTSHLTGTLHLDGNLKQSVSFKTDIQSDAGAAAQAPQRGPWEIRAVQAVGNWSPTQLSIARIHLDAFQAAIDGNDIELALPDLKSFKARISGMAPGLMLQADASMPVQSGETSVDLELASAGQALDWLRGLPFIGTQLPVEQATGTASVHARWQGHWRDWLDGIDHPAAHPALHVDATATAQDLSVELTPADGDETPVRFEVPQLDMQVQGNLAAATARIQGEARANDTRASLDLAAELTRSAADGGTPLWNLAIDRLAADATLPGQQEPWHLALGEGLVVTARTGDDIQVHATAGSATLAAPPALASGNAPLELAWQPITWHRAANGDTSLTSSGSARGIQPAWLDVLLAKQGTGPLAAAGMRTDLAISGEWNVQMQGGLVVAAHLQRDSGDLWLVAPTIGPAGANQGAKAGTDVAAGIRTLDIKVQSEGDDVSLALDLDTARAGVINAQLRTRLEQRAGNWVLPEAAPLAGNVRAHLQDLGAWGFFTPPGWRVQGTLDADVTLAGTLRAPQLQGGIQGSGLNIRSTLDGVDLHNGTLKARLDGSRLVIDELTLQGGTGSRAYINGQGGNRTQPPTARGQMTATGIIDWSAVGDAARDESGIAMDFKATLQRMQVLARKDRQLTLSGDLSASLQQGVLRVGGDLNVDRATIKLPEASAPTLGDDVIVVRDSDALDEVVVGNLQTTRPMDLEIKLNMGHDLALQGAGITTRLEGELTIRESSYGNAPVRIIGQVSTDQGRYRAWGQALDVETGVLAFNGPYDNPSLNLVAIRPDIQVRAGVRVSGTLQNPEARLFSEPDLPEAEKLSWVVLGRSPATTSAEGSSMQQAALGLLAGQVGSSVASGIGLDELGLSDQGVSVGKRLGDELYVTYVQGLSGAASTLYLFYDITRRLTLRGQTGDSSAVDLIYTITFD